jgi:hypothetical protein
MGTRARPIWVYKVVKSYELVAEFDTIKECAESLGIQPKSISVQLDRKTKKSTRNWKKRDLYKFKDAGEDHV